MAEENIKKLNKKDISKALKTYIYCLEEDAYFIIKLVKIAIEETKKHREMDSEDLEKVIVKKAFNSKDRKFNPEDDTLTKEE